MLPELISVWSVYIIEELRDCTSQVKGNEMGGACGMHRGEVRCIHSIGRESCRKKTSLKT